MATMSQYALRTLSSEMSEFYNLAPFRYFQRFSKQLINIRNEERSVKSVGLSFMKGQKKMSATIPD